MPVVPGPLRSGTSFMVSALTLFQLPVPKASLGITVKHGDFILEQSHLTFFGERK